MNRVHFVINFVATFGLGLWSLPSTGQTAPKEDELIGLARQLVTDCRANGFDGLKNCLFVPPDETKIAKADREKPIRDWAQGFHVLELVGAARPFGLNVMTFTRPKIDGKPGDQVMIDHQIPSRIDFKVEGKTITEIHWTLTFIRQNDQWLLKNVLQFVAPASAGGLF